MLKDDFECYTLHFKASSTEDFWCRMMHQWGMQGRLGEWNSRERQSSHGWAVGVQPSLPGKSLSWVRGPEEGACPVLRGDAYRWGGKSQVFSYMWAGKLDWNLDEPQIKSKQITWPRDGPLIPGIVLRKPQRGSSGKHVGFLELTHRGWCQGPAGVEARVNKCWHYAPIPFQPQCW